MCGITGVYAREGNLERQDFADFKTLWLANASRGQDACGFAACVGGEIIHGKAPISVKEGYSMLPTWMPKTKWIIGHTRLATLGSEYQNENNHPVLGEKGLLIHNGMVTRLTKKDQAAMGVKLQYEVDTETIVRLLDKSGWGSLKPFKTHVHGSYALAYASYSTPKRLFLLRGRHSPLYIGEGEGRLVFGSEKPYLKALYPDLTIATVKEGTRYTVNGAVVQKAFKAAARTSYYKRYERAWSRDIFKIEDYEDDYARLDTDTRTDTDQQSLLKHWSEV